jgi:hypothetical protein
MDPYTEPDPHGFGSPGSGSVLGMRVRIQEQGNLRKVTNKLDLQTFKKAFVPMVQYVGTGTYLF